MLNNISSHILLTWGSSLMRDWWHPHFGLEQLVWEILPIYLTQDPRYLSGKLGMGSATRVGLLSGLTMRLGKLEFLVSFVRVWQVRIWIYTEENLNPQVFVLTVRDSRFVGFFTFFCCRQFLLWVQTLGSRCLLLIKALPASLEDRHHPQKHGILGQRANLLSQFFDSCNKPDRRNHSIYFKPVNRNF